MTQQPKMTTTNITLYAPPPTEADIGPAYVRLALGVAQYYPDLLFSYLGPADWLEAVQAEPPSLEMLRQHAVAVATATQKSNLPRNRKERVLRLTRALLWLIRAKEDEQIIFSEQVRMLLDVQPESAAEEVFQTAHETIAALLPGDGPLAERWAGWQANNTIPVTQALPWLTGVVNDLREKLKRFETVSLPPAHSNGRGSGVGPASLRLTITGDGEGFAYRPNEWRIASTASVRIDRLYHLATHWGHGGQHSLYSAMTRRHAAGEMECAALLNLGPDRVLTEGLPLALLPELDLYAEAIPTLLDKASLPAIESERLQALHLAEDALQWATANAALLLHGERLRPRAVRRYLMAHALITQEKADRLLEQLADPIQAAHIFAPLIGGPLLKTWLAQDGHSVSMLLIDPPVPSTLFFEVRFT